MLARSRTIRIGAGSLGVGLLVGAAVGALTPGTASTQTTSTTTSSTTTTTTNAAPAPSTTILTDPPPVVLEFFASPTDAVCSPGAPRTRVVLTWSSQAAAAVSIEADGTAILVDAGPTGRRTVALDCPDLGGSESHDLALTATADDGRTASRSATVNVAGPLTATTFGRGGRRLTPDDRG
jgi:hypothetical protein